MFRDTDPTVGVGAHVYRSLAEIRADMRVITEEIRIANECLNIREVLLDMLNEERLLIGSADEWIPELEEAIAAAREANESLRELHLLLSDLREEYRDTRCALDV